MNFDSSNLNTIVDVLRQAARTEIMPRFRRLVPGSVRTKSGPLDLVTEADLAAEAQITEALRALYPGCLVVGEEATTLDPGLLQRLDAAELAFTVDPVDGTANYAAGLPLFGVMVGVLRRGEVVGAVIHDPVGDDTALALRGGGAWMQAADGSARRLQVAAPVTPERMAGAASSRYFPPPRRAIINRNLMRVAAVWDYRCAAHEYRMLADGHCHFLLFNRLLPWDHAPGWLLHREAGGYSAQLDGAPYRPGRTTGGLLCAPDQASWQALHEMLLDE